MRAARSKVESHKNIVKVTNMVGHSCSRTGLHDHQVGQLGQLGEIEIVIMQQAECGRWRLCSWELIRCIKAAKHGDDDAGLFETF